MAEEPVAMDVAEGEKTTYTLVLKFLFLMTNIIWLLS
jgi:hypothetical protein